MLVRVRTSPVALPHSWMFPVPSWVVLARAILDEPIMLKRLYPTSVFVVRVRWLYWSYRVVEVAALAMKFASLNSALVKMFPAIVVRFDAACSMKISGAVPVAMIVLSMIEVSGEVSSMKIL